MTDGRSLATQAILASLRARIRACQGSVSQAQGPLVSVGQQHQVRGIEPEREPGTGDEAFLLWPADLEGLVGCLERGGAPVVGAEEAEIQDPRLAEAEE